MHCIRWLLLKSSNSLYARNNRIGLFPSAMKHLYQSSALEAFATRAFGANIADKRAIVSGIGLSYVEVVVGIIITFALTPITLGYLGPTAYGLWAALGSIVGYFGLLNFGMNDALVKYVAEYRARDQIDGLNKLFNTAWILFLGIGAMVIGATLLLAPWIPRIFNLSSDLAVVGQTAFVIMGSNVALSLFAGVLNSIIYGYQRVDVLKGASIAQVIGNAALTVLLLYLGFGLTGVVAATSLSILGLIFFYWWFIRNYSIAITIDPRAFNWETFKGVAPLSLRVFVLGLTSQVLYRTDNIVIAAVLGVALVTPYSIAYKLTFMAATLCIKVSDTLYPTYSRLYALGDMDGLRSLLLRILNVTFGIMVPMAIYLVLFGRSFITLWVGGENFAGMGVLIILVLVGFVHALGPAYTMLKGMGNIREVMYSSIADAMLNLALSIILAQQLGLVGVALGTLIGHLCTDTWVVIWATRKHLKLPVRSILTSGVIPPLVAGIPAAILSWVVRELLPENLLALLFAAALTGITYVGFYFILEVFILRNTQPRSIDPAADIGVPSVGDL